MCLPNQTASEPMDWLDTCRRWAWQNRETLGLAVVTSVFLAAFIGVLVHEFAPSDIERAQRDTDLAWTVIFALEKEAVQQRSESQSHKSRAADYQKAATEWATDSDVEWVAKQRVMALECARLAAATMERRDHLVRLATEYRQRTVQAEREILRAKTARELGTPYDVAPRVRELLNPILSNH